MKTLHLTLILIAALWSVVPASSPLRPLFGLSTEDPASGDPAPASDPETDPNMINTPPPR